MSSPDNTLEIEDGDSTANQESLPSTTSVLDKSRSLFGNSSAMLSTPIRDPTPDAQEGKSDAVTDSSVTLEAQGGSHSAVDAVSVEKEECIMREELQETTEKVDTAEDTNTPVPEKPVQEVEESFEKKLVSMDTSGDEASIPKPIAEPSVQENAEEKEELQEEEEQEADENETLEDEDEEEEEVPKKKAKRAASISEDDEAVDEDGAKQAEDVYETSEEKFEVVDTHAPAQIQQESQESMLQLSDEVKSSSESVANNKAPEEIGESEKLKEAEGNNDDSKKVSETPEQDKGLHSSIRSTRAKRTSTAAPTPSTSSTPKRGVRGRQSNIKPEQDDSNEKGETSARRGRSSRGEKREEAQDVVEEPDGGSEEKEEEAEKPLKKRRSTRSGALKVEAEQVPEESSEAQVQKKVEIETPKRGRGKRSAALSVLSTPRSTRGKGKEVQVNSDIDEEPIEEQEEEQKQKTRTPRGKKSTARAEDEKEENGDAAVEETEASTSSRRSTRSKVPMKSAPATPALPNKRTPARERKKQVSASEEVIDEVDETDETPPTKKGRGAAKSAPSSSKKKNEYDPYDLDTEMEHHPEPLKNIHMEVQNFGTVKYAKSGESESKYSMTEKAAESRIADLHSSPQVKNRRSLADMTPGKDKIKHRMSVGTGGRKPRTKKDDQHENDIEMEDAHRPESSSTPASSNRGRKRKSEASELTTPLAKKEPQVILKVLTDEEQLQVDHPEDDNEPHAPGARVFAVFQKTFYPAVILTERDGIGRYKLQFSADKVVKDVPNSGIIPLRDLTKDKMAIYNEEDVRLIQGPDDISAEEWAKGKVTIAMLDENNEPTDDRKIVDWMDISFDQTEWRDYIKCKEQNATAIATSNITTISEASRARKPAAISQQPKPKSRKRLGADLVSSRGASASPTEDDDDKLLPMKEEAIGKNIFSGKVFMLTSANRSNSANVPSMFKKKNLMNFITQHGGIVTEQLNSFQERYSTCEPLLISDTYYRTHKYLAALARGIPCVSNIWLQACGEKGECIDYKEYVLPAGASIFDESQDMPAPKNPKELLKGTAIYVHSTHSAREQTQTGPGGTFIEIWKPILELLGATIVDGKWETLHETGLKFDVVLVDGTFRDEVMEYADSIGASRVTSEWVIQTIILSKVPEPTAHHKFDPYRLHHRTRH